MQQRLRSRLEGKRRTVTRVRPAGRADDCFEALPDDYVRACLSGRSTLAVATSPRTERPPHGTECCSARRSWARFRPPRLLTGALGTIGAERDVTVCASGGALRVDA